MTMTNGEQFEAMVIDGEQTRLDTEAVKALLDSLLLREVITQKEAESCFKTITMKTLKTNRKDKALTPKWVAPTLGPNATPEMVIDHLGTVREQKKNLEKTEGFLKDAYLARMSDAQAAALGAQNHQATTSEEAGFSLFDSTNVGGGGGNEPNGE